MTPLPKRRHSTRRGGKRQASIKLSKTAMSLCTNCGKPKLPHAICKSCGFYNGKEVQKLKIKKAKKK